MYMYVPDYNFDINVTKTSLTFWREIIYKKHKHFLSIYSRIIKFEYISWFDEYTNKNEQVSEYKKKKLLKISPPKNEIWF